MARHPSITKRKFLRDAQVFHFFTRTQCVLFYTGHTGRDKRIESLLPFYERNGKLKSHWRNGVKVYCVPRKGRRNVEHGLACSEILVRLWRSKPIGELFAEKEFKTYKCVPEFGIHYPNDVLLLVEYSTFDNARRTYLMKMKIKKYQANLEKIETDYQANPIVLFIMDLPRARVEKVVSEIIPEGPFYFTDYTTFKKVAIGGQLAAEIYIYGEDLGTYSLTG